jgi:membrane associated rhomboid family serine protease
MIPIKDTIRSRSFPLVTWTLIILNVLVFIYETNLSAAGLNRLFNTYGLVANHIVWSDPATWYPFFTHMFLHGGWMHIISNMWFLAIFGDNVEDRLGSGRYLLFYLSGGLAAGLMQYFLGASASTPSIGASGAIAAVLGAYFLFFPRARVVTFVPIFILGWFVNIPAVVFLGLWFISQLFSGLAALTPAGAASQTIAVWAHIGGFLYGLLAARLFAGGRMRYADRRDEYYPW